jgi:cytochrome c oxidase subunit II
MGNPSASGKYNSAQVAARIERRWAILSFSLIALLVAVVIYSGVHGAMMPPSRVETVRPETLNSTGEFVESNLGSALEQDGSVTVRVIAQQYSFTPQCLLVPAGTPVTFRATSADVVHGFLVTGTNINSMVEPGYISTFRTTFPVAGDHLMPCHEYCGTGHQGMWAHVKVIDRASFMAMAAQSRRLSCVE